MVKEIRNTDSVLTAPENREVTGYALIFNSESNDLGGFTEIILPRALDGVLDNSDILCLLDHNEDRGVLARYRNGSGSLSLTIDERGLKYTFEAPNTVLGDELLEGIKREDITASSFAFVVGDDSWTKRSDGSYLRTINSFSQILDVSPVYRAAYDATSVTADTRGLDLFKKEEKTKLDNYYNELRKEIK